MNTPIHTHEQRGSRRGNVLVNEVLSKLLSLHADSDIRNKICHSAVLAVPDT